jgi:hypothetical protein
MQPARHSEITESKESERPKIPQLLSKRTKAEQKATVEALLKVVLKAVKIGRPSEERHKS